MKPEPSKKKSAREATPDAFTSENGAPMDAPLGQEHDSLPTEPRDSERAQREAESRLLRWDELSPRELQSLADDESTASQLGHLQAAERWLQAQAPAVDECPAAEELYDHGQGPGFGTLTPQRASEIVRHVESCDECSALVQTLRHAPPSPLILEPESAAADEPSPLPSIAAARHSMTRRLAAPLAAAAAVLAVFGFWQFQSGTPGSEVLASLPATFPQATLLRGGETDLAFPRGLVLERHNLEQGDWATNLRFEIRSEAPADRYRVEIFRHTGSAFDEGNSIGVLTSESPTLEPDADLLAALTPGHYTWEAWSLRAGLERRLGARDFEIRKHDTAWRTLEEALESEGSLGPQAVRYLHELGFVTDAVRLTSTLPSSPERDAYLEATRR